MRYLKGTANFQMKIEKGKEGIVAYCDADWGSDCDKRRSCSGYTIKWGGNTVIWTSKRQPIVALSSTEAEYIALSTCTCDVLWVIQLMNELQNSNSNTAVIHVDNESSIKLASSEAYRPRTKHIDIRYHHVRQYVDNGIIKIKHVSTKGNEADALTKGVTREKLKLCSEKFSLCE
jgi:hypothetical protein